VREAVRRTALLNNIFQELSSHVVSSPLNLSILRQSERRIGFNVSRLLSWLNFLFIVLGCYGVGFSQVAIQTSVSTDQNSASTKISSPVFSTSAANELLLALIATDDGSSTNMTVQSVIGAGLTWSLVERTNKESGTAEIWRAFASAPLSDVSVTANLSQAVVSSITVLSFTGVATTGANGSGAIGTVGSGYAASGAPKASLLTTQNGSLVVGVGNDYDNAIGRLTLAGQTLIHQHFSSTGDTYWVQQLSAPVAVKGTTATLGDSAPTTDRYNLSICEVVPATSSVVRSSSQLTLSPSALAFGNVNLNTISTKTLTLTSSGTAAVKVNSATLTGAGFTMSGARFPVTLKPGQTATLQVSFDATVAGAASGTITISSNSSSGSTSTVPLSGTGVSPRLTLSASTLAFGNVHLNTISTKTLTLTSSGTAAVKVNSATLSGTGFAMSGATFPSMLNPGQTLTLQVSFDATVAGAASGKITISSNSSSGSTSTVGLSGSGTSSTNPVLSLSTTTLSFGSDPVGTADTLPVALTSTGTSAVTVSAASITGAGFTFSGATFPVTLNPNIAITTKVQFDPAAVGAASGTLTFTSNSTSGNTSVVRLSGTSTAVQHQVSLSWSAPVNSPVPVTGYNIYRATGSSTSFQLLNPSVGSQTTYIDLAVVTSTSYKYYVTSVDAAGTESIASNRVTVTIP